MLGQAGRRDDPRAQLGSFQLELPLWDEDREWIRIGPITQSCHLRQKSLAITAADKKEIP